MIPNLLYINMLSAPRHTGTGTCRSLNDHFETDDELSTTVPAYDHQVE